MSPSRKGLDQIGLESEINDQSLNQVSDHELYQLVRRPTLHAVRIIRRELSAEDWLSETISGSGKLKREVAIKSINCDNLDGFTDLVEGIRERPVVAGKFSLPYDESFELIMHEVASLPLTLAELITRANGPDDSLDEALLKSSFAQQELYLLNVDPRVDIIIPILGAKFTSAISFNEYEIVEFTSLFRQRFRDGAEVSPRDVQRLADATHAIRIANVACVPGGYGEYFVASPKEETDEIVSRFFQAVAILLPGHVTHAQIGFFPRGWSTNLADAERPYVYLLREYGFRIDNLDSREPIVISAQTANEMGLLSNSLSAAHPSVRVAARRLVSSYDRDNDEDRIIDLSIALEAILGSGFSETVHRISLRAAALLSLAGWTDSKKSYDAMKGMYSYRSRVVHGTPGPHKQDLLKIDGVPIHASRFAIAALCSLLKLILSMENFHPDKIDEAFVYAAFDIQAAKLRESNDRSRGTEDT